MEITAPYRFVPLNKEVFIPKYPEISLDKPYKEGESGIIEITLRNETPIFIKNGEEVKDAEGYLYPEYVEDEKGNRHYFIPSTSWKGMVRSVLEIMSFARMSQYNDRQFSYRDIANETYRQKMDGVLYGWLKKEGSGEYYLFPCEAEQISIHDIPDINGVRYCDIEQFNSIEKYHQYQGYPKVQGKTLVFTGHMGGKKHEYLFTPYDECKSSLRLDENTINDFLETYKDSPYNAPSTNKSKQKYRPFLQSQLESHKYIPVFYHKKGNQIRLGFTKMYRLLYKQRIKDLIYQSPKIGLDLVQRLLGDVCDDNTAYRGRVQFSHTFVPDAANNLTSQLQKKELILGEPKATFFPLYIKDGKTYDDATEIAGRKRYVIHKGIVADPSKTQRENNARDNENVKTKVLCLPAGCDFTLKVRFHNLLPEEIGALLSALTFHNTKGLYHNIGMAKAYGYGKLSVGVPVLHYTKEQEPTYYMAQFENMMNQFIPNWLSTSQIQAMALYATPQESTALKVMNLNDFRNTKRPQNKNQLHIANLSTSITIRSIKIDNTKRITALWTDYELIPKNNYRARRQMMDNILFLDGSEQKAISERKKINEQENLWIEQQWAQFSVYLSNRQWNEAEDIISSVKQASNTNVDEHQKQLENCRRDEQIEKLNRKFEDYLQQNQLDEAEAILAQLQEIHSDNVHSQQEELRLAKQNKNESNKPIAERLTFTSAGAFANSIKKINPSDEQFEEILNVLGNNLEDGNIKKKLTLKECQKKQKDFEKTLGIERTKKLFLMLS